MPSSIASSESSSSATLLESPPDSPRGLDEQPSGDSHQASGFTFILSTQYSGDYCAEWHQDESHLQGLDNSWIDPTPQPLLSVENLCAEFIANFQRERLLPQSKQQTHKELLKISKDHDFTSLQIALNVYIQQMDGQVTDLEVVDVLKRNLIDEYGRGFVHFNFLVRSIGSDVTSTIKLFFAEVHPDCKGEEDVYLCCPIQEGDNGHCFGCKDRAKFLVHPNSREFIGGHKDIGFPFMELEDEYDGETTDGDPAISLELDAAAGGCPHSMIRPSCVATRSMEAKLAFSQDIPPLPIICAAKFAGVPLTIDPSLAMGPAPIICFSSGESICGINPIIHYIARAASFPSFCGQDATESVHVLEWLEYAPTFLSDSKFEVACSFVDEYLASRTFMVGIGLTIADIAMWANLAGIGERWESLRKSEKYQNLARWFNSIGADYIDTMNDDVAAYVGK